MTTGTDPHLMTAEELERYPESQGSHELVRGILVSEPPAGGEHGAIAAQMAHLLLIHVRSRRLGAVLVNDTGFVLARGPDTVRGPDVAFRRSDPTRGPLPSGFVEGPPELAVEVTSPGDRQNEIEAKVSDYLAAGCPLVWVVMPGRRSVRVYRTPLRPRELRADDWLEGEEVVPGFRVQVREIFEI